METETMRVQQVTTTMSNVPPTLGFTSLIKIEVLYEVIEELLEDVTGTTHVASYMTPPTPVSRVLLKPRSFDQDKLSRLLRRRLNRDTYFSQYLADEIALCRYSRAHSIIKTKDLFLMSVNVRVVIEIRFILSSVYVPSSGASVDVFQRLLEEQTVEPVDLDEKCSICLEKLWESSLESSEQYHSDA